MRSPAPFQGFIHDQLNSSTRRDEHAHQQQEEYFAHLQRRPACSTEHMMEHVKLSELVQAHYAQRTGHRSPPMSQQRPFQQNEHLPPGGASEPCAKGSQKQRKLMRGHG